MFLAEQDFPFCALARLPDYNLSLINGDNAARDNSVRWIAEKPLNFPCNVIQQHNANHQRP